MFLFTIRSRVKPKSSNAERLNAVGGAYVNCWISFKDFEGAEKLAKLLIKEQGWIPEKITEASKIQKKKLKTNKDKQYYSEAIKYGYSLVFNMWPKDAEDSGVNYDLEDAKAIP